MTSYKQFIGPRQRRRIRRRRMQAAGILVLLLMLLAVSWTSRPVEEGAPAISETELGYMVRMAELSSAHAKIYAEQYPEYATLFTKAEDKP